MANIIGPIVQGIGAAAGAYGTYLQAQQAEADYERAIQMWREEQERQARMDANSERQQRFQNDLAGGNYSRSMSQDIQLPYIQYARALGR